MMPGRKFRRAMLYGKQDGLCAYCGVQMTTEPGPRFVTLDHVTPLSKGGVDGPDNEVAACHQCNRLKGCMTVAQIRALADAVERLSTLSAPPERPGTPSTSAEPECRAGLRQPLEGEE